MRRRIPASIWWRAASLVSMLAMAALAWRTEIESFAAILIGWLFGWLFGLAVGMLHIRGL